MVCTLAVTKLAVNTIFRVVDTCTTIKEMWDEHHANAEDKKYLKKLRYITTVAANSSLPRVDICVRPTHAAELEFAAANRSFREALLGFESTLLTVYDNSFGGVFNATSNFAVLLGPVAAVFEVYEEQAQQCGSDTYSKHKCTCGGGCAKQRFDESSPPFAVADSTGLLNGVYTTAVHESGHLFGANHDRVTADKALSMPLDRGGSRHRRQPGLDFAFQHCTDKGADTRTIMAYPCKWGTEEIRHTKHILYFSSSKITVNGMVIGSAAGPDGYGADNTQIVYDNWPAVAANAELFDDVEHIQRE
jgi:hypothetical protein